MIIVGATEAQLQQLHHVSRAELRRKAPAVACGLRGMGLQPGKLWEGPDRTSLSLPLSLDGGLLHDLHGSVPATSMALHEQALTDVHCCRRPMVPQRRTYLHIGWLWGGCCVEHVPASRTQYSMWCQSLQAMTWLSTYRRLPLCRRT